MSSNYNTQWNQLIEYARKHGLVVKLVPSNKLNDYAAMNPEAGKLIHFPIPKNEIWVDVASSLERRVKDLMHELIERNLMLEGDPYWQAHCIALRREKKPTKRMI